MTYCSASIELYNSSAKLTSFRCICVQCNFFNYTKKHCFDQFVKKIRKGSGKNTSTAPLFVVGFTKYKNNKLYIFG